MTGGTRAPEVAGRPCCARQTRCPPAASTAAAANRRSVRLRRPLLAAATSVVIVVTPVGAATPRPLERRRQRHIRQARDQHRRRTGDEAVESGSQEALKQMHKQRGGGAGDGRRTVMRRPAKARVERCTALLEGWRDRCTAKRIVATLSSAAAAPVRGHPTGETHSSATHPPTSKRARPDMLSAFQPSRAPLNSTTH